MRWKGQVALITGASSGIGESLARNLAREGADLVLMARRKDRLETLRSELTARGARVVLQIGSVTEPSDLDAAVRTATASFGKLDLVVANAGFGVVGFFENLAIEDYRRQFETNVFGLMDTVRASLPELKKSRGRLVLIGSVAGHVALPNASAYAMSKFAVRAFASSIYGELKQAGVSVTLISPGFVASEIRQVDNRGEHHAQAKDPLPAWLTMTSDQAANKILSAAYRRKRESVVTFHGKVIVWVQRLFPWVFSLMASRGVKGRAEPG